MEWSRSEGAAEGTGRAEQRREKGEAAAEGRDMGRGRGRDTSSGGEERGGDRDRAVEPLGNWSVAGCDFCSRWH
jgi:hypothetical protein